MHKNRELLLLVFWCLITDLTVDILGVSKIQTKSIRNINKRGPLLILRIAHKHWRETRMFLIMNSFEVNFLLSTVVNKKQQVKYKFVGYVGGRKNIFGKIMGIL